MKACLKRVRRVLKALEPGHREPRVGEMGAARLGRHRRLPEPRVVPLVAPVELRREVHVLVADERARVESAARPWRERSRRVVGASLAVVADVCPAVLGEHEYVGVDRLHVLVHELVGRRAEQPLVAERQHAEARMPTERHYQVVRVAHRVVAEVVVGVVEVVRYLRLDDYPELVAGVHVLVGLGMRVVPDEVETRAARP